MIQQKAAAEKIPRRKEDVLDSSRFLQLRLIRQRKLSRRRD